MSRNWLSGLRGKALLIGLLPAVIMSLLIGGYLINTRLEDLQQALQSRGQALANELAAISVYGLFSGNTTSLRTSAQSFLKLPDIASISIRSTDNSAVIKLENHSLVKDKRPTRDHRLYRFQAEVTGIPTDTPFDVSDPVANAPPPEPLGSVEITLVDRSLTSLQKELLFTALTLFLGGVLLTAILALIMSQRIVRPIISLSDAVKRLQQGDFSARVAQNSHDEIGILEAGFNKMAARVAMTQDELTTEIDQAVSDLQVTMDALEIRNIELDLARKKAIRASQAKSDFLAIISHEIRTPMNAIVGFARLLGKTGMNDQQAAQLKAIRDSADNLLAIINDVLDFSKLESEQISFHAEPFRLRQLVDSVITLFTPQASEKGLLLKHMVYSDVPDHVIGDSLRIRQVLINLLGNAIKFTPEGTVTLRVMIDGEEDGDLITFSVQDTGIGLPEDSIERLFQPFTQADISTDRRYGGTGLGLSISKKLVEGMHGKIGVDSTPDQGATFWFTLALPLADNILNDRDLVMQEYATSRSGHPIQGLRILLADDNPINLELAHAILSSLGARLTTARTGQQALALASEKAFDLILMDVHMPVMNGLEATRHIRETDGPNSSTPIVAITADAMAENQQEVFHAGMNEVLLKPIDDEKLIDVISSFFSVPDVPHDTPTPAPAEQASPSLESLDQLPLRDLEAALKTAAGDRKIADRLFTMLISNLEQELDDIAQLAGEGAWKPLWDRVHKLLGAAAACGVPALHATLRLLEKAATEHRSEIAQQLIGRIAQQLPALKASAADAEAS